MDTSPVCRGTKYIKAYRDYMLKGIKELKAERPKVTKGITA